jgi:hypothetical protein
MAARIKKVDSSSRGGVFYKVAFGLFIDKLTFKYGRKLKAAGKWMAGKIKEDLSTMSPPVSAPGEVPHMVTGKLRRGVKVVVGKDMEIHITSAEKYGLDLELGREGKAARPWMRPSLKKYGREALKRAGKGKTV